MFSIKYYIANASEELSKLENLIESSFLKVVPIVSKELGAKEIDIIFLSVPSATIPEMGVGGF